MSRSHRNYDGIINQLAFNLIDKVVRGSVKLVFYMLKSSAALKIDLYFLEVNACAF